MEAVTLRSTQRYEDVADILIVRTACVRVATSLVGVESLPRMHTYKVRTKA